MAAKQRRGKKQQASAGEGSATGSNTIDVQIAKARETVQQARAQAATLHSQWLLHLLRLSYMVILVTMHQWQTPLGNCIKDVKSYNKSLEEGSEYRLSGIQAMYYAINDSLSEILSVAMGVLLTLFLNQFYQESLVTVTTPAGTSLNESFFTNKYYMLATGLVPAVINFYYLRTKKTGTCLEQSGISLSNVIWDRDDIEDDSVVSKMKGFPVIVVFHVIVTACCWFMDFQQSQQNHNVLLLEKLKRDLAKTRVNQE